jgi:hypothetical protein
MSFADTSLLKWIGGPLIRQHILENSLPVQPAVCCPTKKTLFPKGSPLFDEYLQTLSWAIGLLQKAARHYIGEPGFILPANTMSRIGG